MLACAFAAFAAESESQGDPDHTTIALEALSRLKGVDLNANPAVMTAVLKVLGLVRGTPQFVELVNDFKITGQDEALLEIAARYPTNSAGAAAMRLVLKGQNLELLQRAMAGTNAAHLAEALGNTGEKEIVPLLAPIVADAARDLVLRKSAVRALALLQEGTVALLKLAAEQRLPDDVKLTASSELSRVRWQDLKAQAAQLLPLPQGQNAQPLPALSELTKMKGDPARGAAVFRRDQVACIKCHQVNSEGIDFGPNLSEIGAKLGKDALYESILDPSAGISFGFEAWQLALRNGDEAYGLIVSETADELALKAIGGIVTRYKKSDIANRTQQKLSIMPAGLQQAMSLQDFVDLVEYLASLKHASR